ncbi:Potassium voltage-gated channel sub D member 1 [Branchiostoma belcheri]|nr:Potassium voltage-gated channel sub D member 1 [Branchiostoma belcheri]
MAAFLGLVPTEFAQKYSPRHRKFSVLLKRKDLPTTEQRKNAGDERILLNVGGTKFEVWRATLEEYPETLLGSDGKERYFNPSTGEYYFDRDPMIFRTILNFYLTSTLHFPHSENVHFGTYEDELSFFQIDPDIYLGGCCFENYMDRKSSWDDMNKSGKDIDLEPRSLREKLWIVVENPKANSAGQVFFYVTGFFIAMSVAATVIETISCRGPSPDDPVPTVRFRNCKHIFFAIESACVALFTCEYLMRLYAAPVRLQYVLSFMSVVDLISIFPFYLGLCVPEDSAFQGAFDTLRVFRVFRVFKLCRSSPGMRILGTTLKKCAANLSSLCFALSMLGLVFTTMVFYMEKGKNESLTSIPAGFWFTIVTMTTVGYGDIVPSAFISRCLTGVWSISSVVILALPLTILVDTFQTIRESYQAKEKISQRTKPEGKEVEDGGNANHKHSASEPDFVAMPPESGEVLEMTVLAQPAAAPEQEAEKTAAGPATQQEPAAAAKKKCVTFSNGLTAYLSSEGNIPFIDATEEDIAQHYKAAH